MSKEAKKHSDNKNSIQITEETKKQFEQERPKSLESMMFDIERRQNEFEHEQISLNEKDQFVSDMGDGQEKSRKTFYREFKKV
ncbi:unnamed protein product [Rotaria sp. Silwood2]|nr:unnamed protein product [Rotaria sp. Silwood2]